MARSSSYDHLGGQPRTVRDLTERWGRLKPISAEVVEPFCRSKRITVEALEALDARLAHNPAVYRDPIGWCLAYAGWNKGKNAREARARAFSEWNLPFAGAQDWEHVRRCADSVWAQLNLMQPPDDWCPSSPDDPILDEAFTQAWPHAR